MPSSRIVAGSGTTVATTQVSDEEVQKYYEEHKDLYKREKLPVAPQKSAEPAAGGRESL